MASIFSIFLLPFNSGCSALRIWHVPSHLLGKPCRKGSTSMSLFSLTRNTDDNYPSVMAKWRRKAVSQSSNLKTFFAFTFKFWKIGTDMVIGALCTFAVSSLTASFLQEQCPLRTKIPLYLDCLRTETSRISKMVGTK